MRLPQSPPQRPESTVTTTTDGPHLREGARDGREGVLRGAREHRERLRVREGVHAQVHLLRRAEG